MAIAARRGLEVILVEPEAWPAEDPNEVLIHDLRSKREALCLTRQELARMLGMGALDLRDLEVGRAAPERRAKQVAMVLETIENSVSRVKRLKEMTLVSSSAEGESSPQANDARPSRIRALQAALLTNAEDATISPASSAGAATAAEGTRDSHPAEADDAPSA